MEDQFVKNIGKERIMGYGIAGLCIFLSFLLFYDIPTFESGNVLILGEAENKTFLSNILPGIIFFLFGAVILVYLLSTQTDRTARKTIAGKEAGNPYLQNDSAGLLNIETLRRVYQKDFRIFSDVFQKLDQNESVPERLKKDFESIILNLKGYLTSSVWDENWGSYKIFKEWLSDGCPEPAPPEIEKGVRFFTGKMTVARNRNLASVQARRNKELQLLRRVR